MTRSLPLALALVTLGLVLAGCVTPSPFGLEYVPAARRAMPRMPPGYVSLKVPNACFVESVAFFDFYQTSPLVDGTRWQRVLQWADRKDDYSVRTGHAVSVFVANGRLWAYDLNFGLIALSTSVAKRADVSEIAPQITARYPNLRPVMVRYEEDFARTHVPEVSTSLLQAKAGGDLGYVLDIARRFAPRRPVRVIEFRATIDGNPRDSAAVAFPFGNKLCLYYPTNGTQIMPLPVAGVDDLRLLTAVVRNVYPDAQGIRWSTATGGE